MKAFKLIVVSFLLITNLAFADDDKDIDNKESTSFFSTEDETNNDTPVKDESDKVAEENKEVKDQPKHEASRAIGSLLSNKGKKTATKEATTDPQKRIQELEELIKEQQKLIEMYKNKSK